MTRITIIQALTGLFIGTAYSDTTDRSTGSSYLQIQIPSSLDRTGGYDHTVAQFGTYPYGASITQPLYYADDDFCDDDTVVNRRKGYPVRPVDGSEEMEPWKPPFILMVDNSYRRCTFVEKVRKAQHAGAAAVVIADYKCRCDDTKCIDAPSIDDDDEYTDYYYPCDKNSPAMLDDGSGGDITIPAVLLRKQDADAIKSQMYDGVGVQMTMRWYDVPSPPTTKDDDDRKVEYELWSTPTDPVFGREGFVAAWKTAATGFGDRAYFTPRQYLFDGTKAHCRTKSGANMCYNLCTNSGRYCALDPDRDMDRGISGADVVNESLRRICIWRNYGEDDGIGAEYWDYLRDFMARCDTPEMFAREECVVEVYAFARVDKGIIRNCMVHSGGTIGDTNNNLLDLEMKAKEERNVYLLPALYVNDRIVPKEITGKSVMDAVCAGYSDGTEPDICGSGNSMVQPLPRYEVKVSKGSFGLTLLLTCSVFAVGAHLYRRRVNENMQSEVRDILSEYMPLEGGDDDGHDDGVDA